ncbi:MAG: hypothetical protein IKT39_05860 [Clostridia bacterium]|nr:hypothetical protein [Clostridia bacterium]
MSYFTEKAAYLKGLAEGLEIDSSTKEGKLLLAMLEVIEDMADEIEMLDEKQDDMLDLISDLADEDCDCCDDDLDYFEIECEKCGNVICLDEDILVSDEDIVCPVCGEVIELEIEDCDCCDCDDCH